jgi:hypothetical protein
VCSRSALRRSFLESCRSTEEDEEEEEEEVCAFLRDEEGDLEEDGREREVEDQNRAYQHGHGDETHEAELLVEDKDRDGSEKAVALIQEGTPARLSRMPTFIVPPAMSVEDVTLASVTVAAGTPAEKIEPEEEKACQDQAGNSREAGERAGQYQEGFSRGISKQHAGGYAPSKEAMGYAQRPVVVGLESDVDVEGSVATFVSCESFGLRMY